MELGEYWWKSGKNGQWVTVGEIKLTREVWVPQENLRFFSKTWEGKDGSQRLRLWLYPSPVMHCNFLFTSVSLTAMEAPCPQELGFWTLCFCVLSVRRNRGSQWKVCFHFPETVLPPVCPWSHPSSLVPFPPSSTDRENTKSKHCSECHQWRGWKGHLI